MKYKQVIFFEEYSCVLEGGVTEQLKVLKKHFEKKGCKVIIVFRTQKYIDNIGIADYIYEEYKEFYVLDISISYESFLSKVPEYDNAETLLICMRPLAYMYISKYFQRANKFICYRGNVDVEISQLLMQRTFIHNDFHSFGFMSDSLINELPLEYSKYQNKIINFGTFFKDESTNKTGNYESNIIGMVGRLSPEKNYELAIEIIDKVQNNDIKIHIYGGANSVKNEIYYKKILETIEEKNLKKRIIFKGISKDKRMYEKFKILLHTSKTEGIPRVGVEALSFGIPTVVFNSFITAGDVVVDNSFNYEYSQNAAEIINKIMKLNKKEYLKLSEKCRSKFDVYEATPQKIDKVIETINYHYEKNNEDILFDEKKNENILFDEKNQNEIEKLEQINKNLSIENKLYYDTLMSFYNRKSIKIIRGIKRRTNGVKKNK